MGLEAARGEIICFFDDDVTFQENFLSQVVAFSRAPICRTLAESRPYDTLHYPYALSLRWRLRAASGRHAEPESRRSRPPRKSGAHQLSEAMVGETNRSDGCPGFGMIYRRAAIEGLRFDELLPTYGGEDRDFSMRVGERYRLLICGDLQLQHHYSTEGRNDGLIRLRECSFGAGRRFAKYGRGWRDYVTVARTFFGDFAVDLIAFARSPLPLNFFAIFVRVHASFQGLRSVKKSDRVALASPARNSFERQEVPILVPNERDS